jgi:hypothetical protein
LNNKTLNNEDVLNEMPANTARFSSLQNAIQNCDMTTTTQMIDAVKQTDKEFTALIKQ